MYKDQKIFSRSQKDFRKKLLENLLKKIIVDLIKIFKKNDLIKTFIKSFLVRFGSWDADKLMQK